MLYSVRLSPRPVNNVLIMFFAVESEFLIRWTASYTAGAKSHPFVIQAMPNIIHRGDGKTRRQNTPKFIHKPENGGL